MGLPRAPSLGGGQGHIQGQPSHGPMHLGEGAAVSAVNPLFLGNHLGGPRGGLRELGKGTMCVGGWEGGVWCRMYVSTGMETFHHFGHLCDCMRALLSICQPCVWREGQERLLGPRSHFLATIRKIPFTQWVAGHCFQLAQPPKACGHKEGRLPPPTPTRLHGLARAGNCLSAGSSVPPSALFPPPVASTLTNIPHPPDGDPSPRLCLLGRGES